MSANHNLSERLYWKATKIVNQYERHQKRLSRVVWPSDWVRTLLFNPTRPDERDPKPSPRVRALELAQGSDSDGPACSDPTRNLKTAAQPVSWALNPNIDSYNNLGLSVRADKNPCSIQLIEQVCLSDSTRRTRTRTRQIRSDRRGMSNPAQP
jgi:hypothetical protein